MKVSFCLILSLVCLVFIPTAYSQVQDQNTPEEKAVTPPPTENASEAEAQQPEIPIVSDIVHPNPPGDLGQTNDDSPDPNTPTPSFWAPWYHSPYILDDYSGDLENRMFLTGDWGGERTRLAEKGISFRIDVNQVFQGVARGGRQTNNGFKYIGTADYMIQISPHQMGLWKGGVITIRGETQFGENIDDKVGSLLPVNFESTVPEHGPAGVTDLTEFYLTQAFSKKLFLRIGRVSLCKAADRNMFAYDAKTQFLNTAFRANPGLTPHVPYSMLSATLLYKFTDDIKLKTIVHDTNGQPNRTGFDTAFHSPEGITVSQEWIFKVKPFGLLGHQRFGYGWSSKDFTELSEYGMLNQPDFLTRIANIGFVRKTFNALGFGNFDKKPDDWGFWYNFDQYLYQEEQDRTQGVGVFGRFGWSDGEANPIHAFYSFGFGGKGIIPNRDHDTFGLGYYCVEISDFLPHHAYKGIEQGVELYYNFEVTPWLHITPDIQYIIDPAAGMDGASDALVFGLRCHTRF